MGKSFEIAVKFLFHVVFLVIEDLALPATYKWPKINVVAFFTGWIVVFHVCVPAIKSNFRQFIAEEYKIDRKRFFRCLEVYELLLKFPVFPGINGFTSNAVFQIRLQKNSKPSSEKLNLKIEFLRENFFPTVFESTKLSISAIPSRFGFLIAIIHFPFVLSRLA